MFAKLRDWTTFWKWVDTGFPAEDEITVPHVIPFSHDVDNRGTVNQKMRFNACLNFIDEVGDEVLDVGPKNWMGEQVADQCGFVYDNTLESDFNDMVVAPKQRYETIMCFEVLEHVMNPALLVKSLYRLLAPGGLLYLSTPHLSLISIYHTDLHFSEYKKSKLDTLFKYAGFEIEKYKIFSICPWWFPFLGVRPLFRTIFHRCIVYKLRKP